MISATMATTNAAKPSQCEPARNDVPMVRQTTQATRTTQPCHAVGGPQPQP